MILAPGKLFCSLSQNVSSTALLCSSVSFFFHSTSSDPSHFSRPNSCLIWWIWLFLNIWIHTSEVLWPLIVYIFATQNVVKWAAALAPLGSWLEIQNPGQMEIWEQIVSLYSSLASVHNSPKTTTVWLMTPPALVLLLNYLHGNMSYFCQQTTKRIGSYIS